MWPSAEAAFVPFNQPLEGVVHWMYVDQENLVTTGMGNLIDPVGMATSLPWTHGDGGPPATNAEIEAAWNTVKTSGKAGSGGGNQGDLTDLRLSDDAIQALVAQKLSQFEGTLAASFPTWSSLFADAQLGMASMAWAMGPAFAQHYPSFVAAINQADFHNAALQSWMRDSTDWVPTTLDEDPDDHPPNSNAGLRPRNLLNRQLFLNAAASQSAGTDPGQLVYVPGGLLAQAVSTVTAPAVAVGQAAAAHPFLAALGVGIAVGGGLLIAQQTGLIKDISPAFDQKLIGFGRNLSAPVRKVGTDLDGWIQKATGRKLST